MTVNELIAELQQVVAEGNGEVPVRFGYLPRHSADFEEFEINDYSTAHDDRDFLFLRLVP